MRLLIHSYLYEYFFVQYWLSVLWNYHVYNNYTTIKLYNTNSDVLRTKSEPSDLRLPSRIKTAPSEDEPDPYKRPSPFLITTPNPEIVSTPKLFQFRQSFYHYVLHNSARFLILSKSRMPLTHPLQSVD